MKQLLVLACIVFSTVAASAQDSIRHRVILIGDAGKINALQKAVIADASQCVLQNKTTVVFLGDNIYPDGMALTGKAHQAETSAILRSQFQPMRAKGAAVYFVPGNHDWDRSGPRGLKKVKQQWKFLYDQNDTLLQLIPANGCPDPVVISLTDRLAVIAFDSEWWLYRFDKTNTDSGCACLTKVAVAASIRQLIHENSNKIILLASHHPFESYGGHGGYFSWKDHIFPLLALNKYLYLPLPLIGSLYPLLRKTFSHPQDLHHALYRDMIQQVNDACEGHPNIIRVAGHEHGLQFIQNTAIQVVSGSGAKQSHVKKGKHALFVHEKSGFVTADINDLHEIIFTYYSVTGKSSKMVFRYMYPFKK